MMKNFLYTIATILFALNCFAEDIEQKDLLPPLSDQDKFIELDTPAYRQTSFNFSHRPSVVSEAKPIFDVLALPVYLVGVNFSEKKLLMEDRKSSADFIFEKTRK